jgi:glycosyltransferase involved in cell wall biosynthesis
METPFVSVLIDTYNHERFIEAAVASVIAQDYPASRRELLIVDDGSTDRTPDILRQFANHARILKKPNGGQASAFNFGIPQCRGEIVAFLDGDDWWAPGKLSATVTAFSANPEVGLIGHGITEVLTDGSQRSELLRADPRFRLDSVEGARRLRLRRSFLGTSRMAYRAEILRRIGTVPETLVFEADEYLFTLAGLFAEVLILREPLTYYRLHSANLFQTTNKDQSASRRKYEVISSLAVSLKARLQKENISPEIVKTIVESVQTEADLLRISLEPCWPWETIRVELQNFRILNANISPARWIFKCLTLLPALFLSSRTYRSLRQDFGASPLYRRTRAKVLPAMRPAHVDRHGQWGDE